MTRTASPHPSETLPPRRLAPSALDDVLRRVQAQLDAAVVALKAQGNIAKTLVREVPGARVIEDLWRHGADNLMEQVRAAPDGTVGTNRLRGEADGPVCGRLVAVALRDSGGVTFGILAAVRTVSQAKLGPQESQRMAEFAAEIAKLFAEPRAHAGLLSWTAFEERARALEAQSTPIAGAILYGDIDQLHVLNKLAGLAAGDQAIAAVGTALQEESLPEGGCVCHISGDRFAVYLPKSLLSQARRVAEQLSRSVSERCAIIAGLRTRLSISFGVASIPAGDQQLTQALAAAEAACRAAKDRGRGRIEIYQDSDQSIVRRNDDVLIANRLRKALETERIGIVAQPLLTLTGDTRTEYYELLVRLVSESGTFVAPTHFMSAATRYQMLIDLDRAVLMRVFERLRAAHERTPDRPVRFSLNLSGPSIGNPDFIEWLSSNIAPNLVPGEWLQFEITETAAVANIAQTQTLIRHLRARNVEFALDDFGTGVSSLAYLKAFDVSMLKLDGSFTLDLLNDSRSESLVRGIAQLCRSMGIQTVAECVETEVTRQRLAELGIDRAQGFLFGQPVPLESVLDPPHAPVHAPTLHPAASPPLAERAQGPVVVSPQRASDAAEGANGEPAVELNYAPPGDAAPLAEGEDGPTSS
ncbi:MAG TPA: GGDEF domain-containing protein [Steroidobacteraceae bacterium]|nr:GGDEF domain-containing protein [Steroidobacteraceae bacterium]